MLEVKQMDTGPPSPISCMYNLNRRLKLTLLSHSGEIMIAPTRCLRYESGYIKDTWGGKAIFACLKIASSFLSWG